MHEEEGTCTSTALVPFSYACPFSDGLRAESRLFEMFGRRVVMQQQWEEGGRGGTEIGFGASVYDCSIVLAYYIESIFSQFEGKNVVELGCGPGLCSIAAGLAGARRVIATDGDNKSVSLTSLNISNNNLTGNTSAARLYWGNEEDIRNVKYLLQDSFGSTASEKCPHFVLASDVAACPYSTAYEDLVRTMVSFATTETTVLIAYQKRHNSEAAFFDLLREKFSFERIPRRLLHQDFRHLPICIIQATLSLDMNTNSKDIIHT